jgi:GNAT superfamily N-acetyltransferase
MAADVTLDEARPDEAERIGGLISEAFYELEVCQWLVPDPVAARKILPAYFTLVVQDALRVGKITCTADRIGAGVWFPTVPGEPSATPAEEWDAKLVASCGEWVDRFRSLEAAQHHHHPDHAPHHYLAILAVLPEFRNHGIGSALLDGYHAQLDESGTAAYLESAGLRQRELYLRKGYVDLGEPFEMGPGSPPLYPMWREPR